MAETVRIEIPIETVDNTDPELSSITKNLDKMGKAADRANSSAKKAQQTVSKFDQQAQKTERSLASWAKEKYEVALEARDRISPILRMVGSSLRSFSDRTWNVTMKAVDLVTAPVRGIFRLLSNPVFQVGTVLGVSIGLADAVDTYKDFEAAMSQVSAVSGATNGELEKLTAKAKEMGATTKFTAEEAAEAFNYMAMAGWKTDDMLSGIEGILSLAAASGEDLATTSDIVTDALTAFGLQAADSGHFADVLAQASSNANTNVSMLGESFKYVAPVAGAMKYSVEDVSLALGLMANASVKGSMAGTALKTSLANLASPTDKMADAMKEYGISLTDDNGHMKTLKDVMDNVRESLGGLAEAEQTAAASTIFGKEAMAGMLAIINASERDYNKLTEAVYNADGAAAKMSDTMLDNLQGSITLLQSAVDGAKLSFGERLSPYIREFAEWLTAQMPAIEQGLDGFMDWIDGKVDRLRRKFEDMTVTQEWQDADFFGKIHIAWDELVAEPFSEWWNTSGRAKFAEYARDIGSGIGTGLKTGIMTLLGIGIGETFDEGASIGASFARGFSEGFDFKAVSEKLFQGFGNLLSNAGKMLPGGESADLSALVSMALLGKAMKPLAGAGKGMYDIGKGLFGVNATTGTSLAGTFLGSVGNSTAGTLAGTGAVGGSGLLGSLANAGYALTGGAATSTLSGGAAALAGAGSIAGGVIGGVSLISGVGDIYHGLHSEDRREKNAYTDAGIYKTGGVAAGAATGAAVGAMFGGIGAVPGALIGAGIGGIAGWIKGNRVKEDYKKEAEEIQREAEKAQKVLEATGYSIDDVRFETRELNDAIHDSEVSAQEFGEMFREAVSNNLNRKFGDLKLSLKEVKELASGLVIGGDGEGVNTFVTAVNESESALATLKNTIQSLDKLNWKAGLSRFGIDLSTDDIERYKSAISGLTGSAKEYVENKQYEGSAALSIILGDENSGTDSLNAIYADLQSQIDSLDGELSAQLNIALEDGVITLDEQKEIVNLQQQITDITDKVAAAEEEAQFSALKIRYGGAGLDADSFANLQEELQAGVEEMTQNYDDALKVSLTNLELQLSEDAISDEEYQKQLKEITDGYNAKIDGLQVRVESFQLDTIADAFASELNGILPDIDGTVSEKLSEAMNRALEIEPDVAKWTTADIAGWFDLEALTAETQENMAQLLRATAETIPENLLSSMSEMNMGDIYSAIDFAGPFSNEYYGQMAALDLSAGTSALASNFNTSLSTQFTGLDFINVGTCVSGGVGDAIMNADMSEINSAISHLKSNTDASVNTAFRAGVSTTMPVNITLDYNVLNPKKDIAVSGNGASGSASVSVLGHAGGGYVSGGPQLSWLAEEGWGEYVIPTNPSRRGAALELYEQAGRSLRITTHAAGGFVNGSRLSDKVMGNDISVEPDRNAVSPYMEVTGDINTPAAPAYSPAVPAQTGASPVEVHVLVNPEFNIEAGGKSEEDIVAVVKRHIKEMTDEIGEGIAEVLQDVFSNLPMEAEA